MNLQQTIRRILKEETHNTRGKIHLLRRVDGELIKKTFDICLKRAEGVYLRHMNKWKYFTLQKYKDFVIGMLIDELYFNNFEDTPPEIFSEIYDFLIDTYSEEISDSYDKINELKMVNEESTNKEKFKKLIRDLGIPTAATMVGGSKNLVKIGYDDDIFEYAKDNDIKILEIVGKPASMYFDDSLVSKLDLPDFNKDQKELGNFRFGPRGVGENFSIQTRLMKIKYSNGGFRWKVVGISGDSGFGYWFINKKDILGEKIRLQIYKQIIEKYNLQQYL